MSSLHENTLVALIALAERGVSHAESAERDADYGVPTFGPSVAEELRAQIEGLHEPLADLLKVLSGSVRHTGALAAIIADPDCCAASKAIARAGLVHATRTVDRIRVLEEALQQIADSGNSMNAYLALRALSDGDIDA